MAFIFERQAISDIILVTPTVLGDDRGFFMETYKKSDFAANGITEEFVQDNHSRSSKGVLRGLHFQDLPRPQGKLIRCIAGEIFDVCVDIRKGSPTFSKWVGVKLSSENKKMIYIPPDFAHGFLVLSDYAEVVYKTTAEFSPENDRGILWNDPDIGIDWGIDNPILSIKDQNHPLLKNADINFTYRTNRK